MAIMLRCLPLLLALVMTQSYAYTITTSYINPTYMSIQIDGLDNVGSVDISLYDWDTSLDLIHPIKVWYPMIHNQYDQYVYARVSNDTMKKYGSLWLPASLRLTNSDTGHSIEEYNIITEFKLRTYTGRCSWTSSSCIAGQFPRNDSVALSSNGLYRGITLWDNNPAVDACMLLPSLSSPYTEYHVALSEHRYDHGQHCGDCIYVKSHVHTEWIEALVIDSCPASYPGISYPNECARYNWLDVSPAVFSDLTNGSLDWGLMQMEYKFGPCSAYVGHKISYSIKENAGQYWFEMQIRQHVIGITNVEIRDTCTQSWTSLSLHDYNYWEGSGVTCPCDIRITGVNGQTLIDINVIPDWSLCQNTTITGTKQFSVVNDNTSSANMMMYSSLLMVVILLLL